MRCAFCPVVAESQPCLGESIPRLCVLAKTRNDYRRHLARLAYESDRQPARHAYDLADVLAEVAVCEDRGSILPTSFQPECGCSELTECLAPSTPGGRQVTLQDCLACVVARREQMND
jgi:hypothetical protein